MPEAFGKRSNGPIWRQPSDGPEKAITAKSNNSLPDPTESSHLVALSSSLATTVYYYIQTTAQT